jgi:hypothetical protein
MNLNSKGILVYIIGSNAGEENEDEKFQREIFG